MGQELHYLQPPDRGPGHGLRWYGLHRGADCIGRCALSPRHPGGQLRTGCAGASAPFGSWGFALFIAALFIACFGACLEVSLSTAYLTAQGFGWNWGESQKPG